MTNTKQTKQTNKKNQEPPEQKVHEPDPKFKRFYLRRKEDISGVSGTGIVCAGCQFEDGTVVLKWLTTTSSISIFHSIVEMQFVHGHEGSTEVIFVDN